MILEDFLGSSLNTVLISLCFLLGIHFSMMLIASCYRIIDLWYRIGDFIGRILLRITLIAAVIVILALSFEGEKQTAFVLGLLFFLGFHITIYFFGQIVIHLISRYRSRS